MIKNNIEYHFADLNNIQKLSNILKGEECLINIASLGFGSASNILQSCKNAYVKGLFLSVQLPYLLNLMQNQRK